jgi:hypothetical protein
MCFASQQKAANWQLWVKSPHYRAAASLSAFTSASGHPRSGGACSCVDRGMPLTLRPTGLSSPAYRDWLDYVIVEDGRDVGRLYEDRHSKPELRWFWSITVYVNPKLGITTSGRAPSIDQAKAQFLASWQKIPR